MYRPRVSRGFFTSGAPSCLWCGLWAEIPLTFWLYRELGLGLAAGQGGCPTPSFSGRPAEGQHQGAPAGGGQSGEGEEQWDERSGVLHPPRVSLNVGGTPMEHAKTRYCCAGVLGLDLPSETFICLIEDPSDKATGNLLYCCYMAVRIKGICWVTESIILLG